ncbi:Rrf2 family transcriptional regulator [Paenibacillus sp. FSL H7-0716]|uniref:Transcriptional regulator n=1 Tax=Paenibacillus odorifer TaxID=189426 RepID=A0AB36JIW3_9BACL|nr:Rrf2 family transcriptional regulator [Paenibacillus odorifer]OME13903.1 transcriptional regulator [Paenibacillus odorifer]OME23480.1 transcriptional regulator [Paenibacillus odorifer]OME62830.1 transcriptional regulator [Paenibacillus odorifer]
MKLTAGVEQAICIIVLLSTQDNKAPLASDHISARLDVSPSYLKKIMRKLVVKQLVTSIPGNNGGFSLAKSPEEITGLEIIEAMEGRISIYSDNDLLTKAFEDGIHASKGIEVLNDLFNGANDVLRAYFSKFTVADLLKKSMSLSQIPSLDWNNTSLKDFLAKEMKEHADD